ncbi:MAG: InlB B-repeat-containing protein [Oscillospiraceae bacterium]|nr:InlB B-repeat-containing protein [Oscillospiraceae bacterium]
MRKFKRIVSSLLAGVMMLSCAANVSAFKYDDGVLVSDLDQTDDKNIPTLSLELFEVGDDWEDTYGDNKGKLVKLSGTEPVERAKQDIIDNAGLENEESKFIVGIVAYNFNNYTEVVNPGFRQLQMGIAYDPDYLKLEPSSECLDDQGDIKDTYGMLYSQRTGSVDSNWRFGSYFQAAVSEKEVKPEAKVPQNLKNNTAVVIQPFNNGARRYKMGNKVYMGFIEFQLLKTPNIGEMPKILSFSKSGEDLALALGDSSVYSYNATVKGLHNYLKLDEKEVNFFPAKYNVDFYNDKDAKDSAPATTPIATITEVPEDNSVKEAGKEAQIPTALDFNAPSGKAFAGLAYDTEVVPDTEEPDATPMPTSVPFTEDTTLTFDKVGDDGTLEVYAVYENGIDITFNSNYPADLDPSKDAVTKPVTILPGGKLLEGQVPTVGKVTNTESPEFDFDIPDGYSFLGWFDAAEDGNKIDFTEKTFDAATPLYAHWTKQRVITLYDNDGTGDNGLGKSQEFTLDDGENIDADDVNTPSRDYYDFKGWNEKRNGSGKSYADAAALAAENFATSTELYAQWEANDDEDDEPLPDDEEWVTLYFKEACDPAKLDASLVPSSITVISGETIYKDQFPDDPTRKDGYVFKGWYNDPAATSRTPENKIPADGTTSITMDKEDVYAYAHWDYEGEDAVTVKFKDNLDNSKDYAQVIVKYGDSIGDAMPANPDNPDKSKTFSEWNTSESDKSGTKLEAATPINDTFSGVTAENGGEVTVYAQYADLITVIYNDNMTEEETITAGPEQQQGAPNEEYKDPTTKPARKNYEFVGWNTKQNGAGEYIPAKDSTETLKYADVLAKGKTIEDSKVTLYAQWAAIDPEDVDKYPEEEPEPKKNGVKVIFDSNAVGENEADPDANPNVKYVYYDDAIGDGNMPDPPERKNYDFKGWFTKPDGTGTEITATTKFGDNLSDYMEELGEGYEITVYAKWDISDEVNEDDIIDITFYPNTDLANPKGGTPIKKQVVTGDAIGYDIDKPENGNAEFLGWYKGSVNESGELVFDPAQEGAEDQRGVKYTKDMTFDADTEFYAMWQMNLYVVPDKDNAEYTGSVIDDITYSVYYAVAGDDGEYSKGASLGTAFENMTIDEDSQFTVTYEQGGTETPLVDVGTYEIKVALKADSALAKQAKIVRVDPDEFDITQKLLTVKVDPAKQEQNQGEVADPEITVEGIAEADAEAGIYDIKYYLWTDANGDDKVDTDELGPEITTVPEAVGTYAVQVTLKTTGKALNYKIGALESKTTGENVKTIDTDIENMMPWERIKFVIKLYSSKATDIKVQVDDGEDAKKDLDLMDDSYVEPKPFDPANDKDNEAGDNDYFVRVGEETDSVDIVITPEDKNMTKDQLEVTVDGKPVSPEDITKNDDGTFTVHVDIEKVGEDPTDIDIKMHTEDNKRESEYHFHVQKVVEAGFVLNPGNSPFGMIEWMVKSEKWDAAKAALAKELFVSGTDASGANNNADYENMFHLADYTPDGAPDKNVNLNSKTIYSLNAWGDVNNTEIDFSDPEINLDRNTTAIFVYQHKSFTDPGFIAKDSLGHDISDECAEHDNVRITRRIKVYRFAENDLSEDMSGKAMDDISVFDVAPRFTFSSVTSEDKNFIRPDIYELEYSFEDPHTGEMIKATRKVVVLFPFGDVDLNNIVNANDQVKILNYASKGSAAPFYDANITPEGVGSLYLYRVVDTDMNSIMNANDQVKILNYASKGSAAPLAPFYPELNEDYFLD